MDGSNSFETGQSRDGESVEPIESELKELHEVMRQDISFEDNALQALEIGRTYLNADNGHLARIDQKTGHWEVIVSTDPPDGQFPPGLEADFSTTYCRRVFESSSQVALHDAPNQGWADDPAYDTHGLHCYVGTPLRVNGEQYGTVCFVATDPRETPYSDSEKLLAELITHMLERELEHAQFETQLTKQTNLSLVLNRVLRHNLRNRMAIIRGYTQMLADRLRDSPFGQTVLSSIDNVLNLSEKARELDEIIASDEERDQYNIRSIVDEVTSNVQSEYPSASISLTAETEITAHVFPSFRRAMRELIENAAKHGGDNPTIDITVELVPNAVEIQIADDGPGIDDQEIGVLRSGSETPLMHGSGLGLWLSHWIVSMHDGSIEASVTETGTTLTVRLPRTPVAEGEQRIRELVRAKDQYKAAFEEAGDGMTITDKQARILDVNDEAARVFGMDRRELLGRSMQEFLPEDFDFEAEWRTIKSYDSKRGELPIVRADEGVSIVEYTAKTDVVPGQHLIVSRDVTEQKEREQELKRLGDFFKEAERLGDLGAWEIDEDGNLRWTAGTRRIHEVDADFEPTLAEAIEFYHKDDRGKIEEAINNARMDGKTINQEARIITAAGNLRWVRASGGPTENGEMVRGYIQDITEQKNREMKLERTLADFQSLFEKAPEPIAIHDSEGRVVDGNEQMIEKFGYSKEELTSMHVADFDVGFTKDQLDDLWEGMDVGEMRQLETEHERKDGTTFPVEVWTNKIEINGDVRFLGFIRDITDRK